MIICAIHKAFYMYVTGGERIAHAYLVIREPPTLSTDASSTAVPFKRGDQITINCRAAKGLPPPELTWYNNYGQSIKVWLIMFGISSLTKRLKLSSDLCEYKITTFAPIIFC